MQALQLLLALVCAALLAMMAPARADIVIGRSPLPMASLVAEQRPQWPDSPAGLLQTLSQLAQPVEAEEVASLAAAAQMASMPGGGNDKYAEAVNALKDDIMTKLKQIERENEWVTEVRKVIDQYSGKLANVEQNIERLRGQVKELYRKKKQIENVQLQMALKDKLQDAMEDLETLKSAIGHVKKKQDEFHQTRQTIEQTIAGINSQLSSLQDGPEEAL